jgi:hypothetical protein
MSRVVPIARYLQELDVDDAQRGASAGGKPAAAGRAAMLAEAEAQAFERGKVAAEQQLAARLDERMALHHKELAASREAWVQNESGRLADQLVNGLNELEARLADTAARILEPFLAAELRRKAIAELVQHLAVLRTRDKQALITIAGAADLLDALRVGLGDKLDNIEFQPGLASDVRVVAGQTVLATQLGAWMARIEEAVR